MMPMLSTLTHTVFNATVADSVGTHLATLPPTHPGLTRAQFSQKKLAEISAIPLDKLLM